MTSVLSTIKILDTKTSNTVSEERSKSMHTNNFFTGNSTNSTLSPTNSISQNSQQTIISALTPQATNNYKTQTLVNCQNDSRYSYYNSASVIDRPKLKLPPISSLDNFVKTNIYNDSRLRNDTRMVRTVSVPYSATYDKKQVNPQIASNNTSTQGVPTHAVNRNVYTTDYRPLIKSEFSPTSLPTYLPLDTNTSRRESVYLATLKSSSSSPTPSCGSAIKNSPPTYHVCPNILPSSDTCSSTNSSTTTNVSYRTSYYLPSNNTSFRSVSFTNKNVNTSNESLTEINTLAGSIPNTTLPSSNNMTLQEINLKKALLADYSKTKKKRQCPICHKYFANLSTHKSTHLTSQDRPHKCIICQRGFARNNDLIRHRKRHWKDDIQNIANLGNTNQQCQNTIQGQRALKKNQLIQLHQIKCAFKCPYNANLIEVDLELNSPETSNSVLEFTPMDCHPTGVFSRCDTFKNHLKALHFEYPQKTKREQRSQVPGKCKHCGMKFPNVDIWLNQHVGKSCGFRYHS